MAVFESPGTIFRAAANTLARNGRFRASWGYFSVLGPKMDPNGRFRASVTGLRGFGVGLRGFGVGLRSFGAGLRKALVATPEKSETDAQPQKCQFFITFILKLDDFWAIVGGAEVGNKSSKPSALQARAGPDLEAQPSNREAQPKYHEPQPQHHEAQWFGQIARTIFWLRRFLWPSLKGVVGGCRNHKQKDAIVFDF